MTADGSSGHQVRDYLQLLVRRRWTVVTAVIVVVGVALCSAEAQTSVYRSAAQILVQARTNDSVFSASGTQAVDLSREVRTQIQLVKSQPIRDAVRASIGVAPSVSVAPIGQTDVFTISADSTDPRTAALIANSFATAYVDFQRTQGVNDLVAAATQIQGRIGDLQHQIDALNGAPSSAAAQGQLASLIQQQGVFRQRFNQLQVDAALKTGSAQLVAAAVTPVTPVSPRPTRDAVIALVVGLMFGCGLALALEYLDDSLKDKDDVDKVAGKLPVLGLIAPVRGWRPDDGASVVSVADPRSPAAESYRALRTSLQFLSLDRSLRVIQVTSPGPEEGKSTIIANLAVALALGGQRVVVVCCDLRRPRIHEFFGLSNDVGLTSVMVGDVSLRGALQSVNASEDLQVLASGPVPPNPAELLGSSRMTEVVTALQSLADVVLLDCPPALLVTDAAVVSARVDATLVVVSAGRTKPHELSRTLELLEQVAAPVVGIVLNGVAPEGSYGKKYQYRYAAAQVSRRPGAKWRREPVAPQPAPPSSMHRNGQGAPKLAQEDVTTLSGQPVAGVDRVGER